MTRIATPDAILSTHLRSGGSSSTQNATAATPSRRLTLLTPEPLSTYGKAVSNYVALNLPVEVNS